MTNREEFLRRTSRFFTGILDILQGKTVRYRGKGTIPLCSVCIAQFISHAVNMLFYLFHSTPPYCICKEHTALAFRFSALCLWPESGWAFYHWHQDKSWQYWLSEKRTVYPAAGNGISCSGFLLLKCLFWCKRWFCIWKGELYAKRSKNRTADGAWI